jgi:hypothetical protein
MAIRSGAAAGYIGARFSLYCILRIIRIVSNIEQIWRFPKLMQVLPNSLAKLRSSFRFAGHLFIDMRTEPAEIQQYQFRARLRAAAAAEKRNQAM